MLGFLTAYRRSLGTRFGIFIGAVLIPLFIVTSLVILDYQKSAFHKLTTEIQTAFSGIRELNITTAKAEDTAKLEKLGNLLAAIAPAAIASYDFTSLTKYAQTAAETPGVCEITYKSPEGKTMAQAKTAGHTPASAAREFQIVHEGSKMGTVVIGYNNDLLDKKIADMDKIFSDNKDSLSKSQAEALFDIALSITISLTIVFILTQGMIIFLFRKFVSAPIHESVEDMNSLARGNLNIDIKQANREDEIGSIAEALQVFKKNAVEREELQRLEKEKDEIAKRRAVKITELSERFDANVRSFFHDLEAALASLESSATELASLAQSTTARATAISNSSQRVNESVSSVAHASEELTGSIREISTQINASTQLIHKTVDQTAKTAEQSELLMNYANKVNSVLDLISNISHQTRLLSLNATIEAERAGDMGKGFAVVAGEVRVLASQTEDSVKQIQQTITDVQNASNHISTALTQTRQNVDAVNSASSVMASAAEEQSSVTSGIAQTMQDAARATNEVTRSIDQIVDSVAKTSAASDALNDASTTLNQKARELRQNVETFLQNIKSA